MRLTGHPEGARRRLDLCSGDGGPRTVEVVRGRAGYGFTIIGQGPCVLSCIVDDGPADQVGLKQGDRILSVHSFNVSGASHEAVVHLIGQSRGPLQLEVLPRRGGESRLGEKEDVSPCQQGHLTTAARQRPVSVPDILHWPQQWAPSDQRAREETDSTDDGEDANSDWSVLNVAMMVGYLGSRELALNVSQPEEECLGAIRELIGRQAMEQDTHTLVVMRVMLDCIRLCDDTGTRLAVFPAQELVLGAVCAEDTRFFCLVTAAPDGGLPNASCHVFFIDPELARHGDHADIAGRFGLGCTLDSDTSGCLEFPGAPSDVLHFVSVLYSGMGEEVERLRVRLDMEAQQPGKQGSASSNGDSGIGNASPPEERAERDFPVAVETHGGPHLPSCPWDYPGAEELTPTSSLRLHPSSNSVSAHSLSESLPGADCLAGLYGGHLPRLEFHFKPPPQPPLPLGKKQSFMGESLRGSQRWFSKAKWPRSKSVSGNIWPSNGSLGGSSSLPPPVSQIPPDRYQHDSMLPPREEWTRRFLEQSGKQPKDHNNKGARFWGMSVRASGRRPGKRLSLARSLDDLESAVSSDGDYGGGGRGGGGGGVQLQGCCSQSSLNSNGSLPGAGTHRRLSDRRVASWAACFERLLKDPVGVRYFSEFLKKEFSEENILFWQACEYFSHVPAMDKKQLSLRAGEIYNSFLSSKATTPVNIDSQAQLADDVLTSPRPDMFKAQQLQIFNLMKFDSYSRFLKSSLYQECMLAEVEGRPLPDPYHIPCSPAPSKHSASSDRSTLSTPNNKEASKQRAGRSLHEDARDESADKKRGIFFSWSRNRSFGKGPKKKDIADINLEYWGSNGRRESQGSLSSGTSLDMATSCSTGKIESDNRHSVAAWERVRESSPKRCSVMLPDGSCSTVPLRPGASIREVLRDLCHNISVNMAAVDLFLVGGDKPLVLDQDCMTLSSRDLRLEKRTLFRLDLVPINRSVGLKAKPTKPVTEVLRPVVAKYGLQLNELVAKISGESEPLDLGAPISSLDGRRVVLDRPDPASGKDKAKSCTLKAHPPSRSLSAMGDQRSSGKDFTVRVSGPEGEKRKQKKINIDEAEEFFELLSRAQSSRANDQRGLLNKEDLVLPDFLRLAPPLPAAPASCSTPQRGLLSSSLRSGSLDSSLGPSSNGHPARRALLPLARHPPFGSHLSPIPRAPEPPLGTVEEDLTLVGEGDISSPNSTLLPLSPPGPPPPPQPLERSLPEANFTPPPPCAKTPARETGQAHSETRTDPCAATPSPTPGQEAMDVEGVQLEEGPPVTPRGEDSELSLSFQGYAAELRQCQSKMKNAPAPQSVRVPPAGTDCKTDVYKATIV